MPIKNIQLKNGSKYPVGEAYKEPITDGKDVDFPFEYDAEAAGTGSIVMTVVPQGASEGQSESFTMYPLTDTDFSASELAAASADASFTNSGQRATIFLDDPIVLDMNAYCLFYLQNMQSDVVVDSGQAFSGLPGNVACAINGIGFAVMSFGAAASSVQSSVTGTIDVQGTSVPVTITVTVTAPKKGSYWVVPIPDLSSYEPAGIVHVCTWNFERFYTGLPVAAITNGLAIELMQASGGLDLTLCPSLETKVRTAWYGGMPLAISLYNEFAMSVGMASRVWTFANGDTITYNPTTHKLTYTAAS